MSETRSGFVDVAGARIFYKARGAGPVLLVLQGGAADADGADGLAAQLEAELTVVSHDRRGLSRSPLDPSATPEKPGSLTLGVHTDDALRVLDALSPGEPAYVLGASIGGLIGLDLIARHPHRVRRLVTHEPPAAELLGAAEQSALVRFQEALEETHRREGALAAMRKFMVALGVNPADREPDMEPPRPGPQLGRNLERFLTEDAPAVRRYRLDLAALAAASSRIVPAVGASSRSTTHAGPALALARKLGVAAVEFPGGHGGYASHPRAFAARLREVLPAGQAR